MEESTKQISCLLVKAHIATTSRSALGLPSLLSNGYHGLFLLRVKRMGHEDDHSPPVVSRLRMCEAISPVLDTSSWHGAWLTLQCGSLSILTASNNHILGNNDFTHSMQAIHLSLSFGQVFKIFHLALYRLKGDLLIYKQCSYIFSRYFDCLFLFLHYITKCRRRSWRLRWLCDGFR
jgi:hypothetical protein